MTIERVNAEGGVLDYDNWPEDFYRTGRLTMRQLDILTHHNPLDDQERERFRLLLQSYIDISQSRLSELADQDVNPKTFYYLWRAIEFCSKKMIDVFGVSEPSLNNLLESLYQQYANRGRFRLTSKYASAQLFEAYDLTVYYTEDIHTFDDTESAQAVRDRVSALKGPEIHATRQVSRERVGHIMQTTFPSAYVGDEMGGKYKRLVKERRNDQSNEPYEWHEDLNEWPDQYSELFRDGNEYSSQLEGASTMDLYNLHPLLYRYMRQAEANQNWEMVILFGQYLLRCLPTEERVIYQVCSAYIETGRYEVALSRIAIYQSQIGHRLDSNLRGRDLRYESGLGDLSADEYSEAMIISHEKLSPRIRDLFLEAYRRLHG